MDINITKIKQLLLLNKIYKHLPTDSNHKLILTIFLNIIEQYKLHNINVVLKNRSFYDSKSNIHLFNTNIFETSTAHVSFYFKTFSIEIGDWDNTIIVSNYNKPTNYYTIDTINAAINDINNEIKNIMFQK